MGASSAIRSMSMRKATTSWATPPTNRRLPWIRAMAAGLQSVGGSLIALNLTSGRVGGDSPLMAANWTFPGVLETNVFRSDPVLNATEIGDFFYLSLRETFYDDIWRSTDGGQAWTRLTFGDVTGGDKEWFTIDKTNGTGHGFLYHAWSTSGNNWGG